MIFEDITNSFELKAESKATSENGDSEIEQNFGFVECAELGKQAKLEPQLVKKVENLLLDLSDSSDNVNDEPSGPITVTVDVHAGFDADPSQLSQISSPMQKNIGVKFGYAEISEPGAYSMADADEIVSYFEWKKELQKPKSKPKPQPQPQSQHSMGLRERSKKLNYNDSLLNNRIQ